MSTMKTLAPWAANISPMAFPMPCAPPVTMAVLSLNRGISQVWQQESPAANSSPRDCRPSEIGHIEFVMFFAAEGHIGRTIDQNRVAVKSKQRFHARRSQAVDVIRGIA